MKNIIKAIICAMVGIIDGFGVYCVLITFMGNKLSNVAAIISLMIAVILAWVIGKSFEQIERMNKIMKLEAESN